LLIYIIGEGKFHKAFNILKESKSSQCRYLFAQTCVKLNRLVEAERALLTDKHYSKSILSKDVESVIPNGSAGYYLLGLIAEKLVIL
jgi:anaphase-promoting complex subunit 3